MKKRSLSLAIGFSAVLLLTAVTASAQGLVQSAKVQIPFAFSIGGEKLPAGRYLVSKNGNTLLIRNTSGKGSVAILAGQTQRGDRQVPDGKLVFHRYGDKYFMSEIWVPGDGLGREFRIKETDVAAIGNSSDPEIVIAIAGQ